MADVKTNLSCNCVRKCERHGKCEECNAHHAKLKLKPYCTRHPIKEQGQQENT